MEWHPGALAALFGVLSASIGLAAQPIKVREEMLYDRPVKTLDNGLVRVSVTPEIGGRVLVFRLNDGDRRTLHIARHNIRRKPGERWRGAEYGGLCDVATLDWPGPFWGVGYKIAETQAGGVAALRLSAQASEIGIEREVMLLPNSTICRIGVKQTNLARVPKSMVIRIHGEFALGECADNHDVILFNGPKGLVEIRYRLGWENPRFSFEHPVEGWMAYVDAREKLALVRRFLPVSKDIKVLVWHGHNEGGAVRDEKGGFYAIDRFMEPRPSSQGRPSRPPRSMPSSMASRSWISSRSMWRGPSCSTGGPTARGRRPGRPSSSGAGKQAGRTRSPSPRYRLTAPRRSSAPRQSPRTRLARRRP